MATHRQILANRRNAQRSTGPVTLEGKQASSRNALKSGIYAESEVLFTERRQDLEALTAEYHERFQPTTPEARDLVDSLIRSSWLLRRFAAAEAALFNCNHNPDTPAGIFFYNRFVAALDGLNILQRRINAAERNYHRTLKALQLLPPVPQPQETEPTSEDLASFPQPPAATPGPGDAPVFLTEARRAAPHPPPTPDPRPLLVPVPPGPRIALPSAHGISAAAHS